MVSVERLTQKSRRTSAVLSFKNNKKNFKINNFKGTYRCQQRVEHNMFLIGHLFD